jgi:hypothetical protein
MKHIQLGSFVLPRLSVAGVALSEIVRLYPSNTVAFGGLSAAKAVRLVTSIVRVRSIAKIFLVVFITFTSYDIFLRGRLICPIIYFFSWGDVVSEDKQ